MRTEQSGSDQSADVYPITTRVTRELADELGITPTSPTFQGLSYADVGQTIVEMVGELEHGSVDVEPYCAELTALCGPEEDDADEYKDQFRAAVLDCVAKTLVDFARSLAYGSKVSERTATTEATS